MLIHNAIPYKNIICRFINYMSRVNVLIFQKPTNLAIPHLYLSTKLSENIDSDSS
jgi:hypothetical protein